jgi:hypothetical protein
VVIAEQAFADSEAIYQPVTDLQVAQTDADGVDDEAAAWCEQMLQQHAPAYHKLYSFLPDKHSVRKDFPVFDLLRLKVDDCQDDDKRQRLRRALSMHNKRIGILLPFSQSGPTQFTHHIVTAAQHYYKRQNQPIGKHVIFKNTSNHQQVFHRKLAELIFKHHVSIVIGGATKQEARLLARWAEALQIATLILNQDVDDQKVRKHVFYVSPDIHQMANAIWAFLAGNKIRRLAILSPEQRQNPLTQAIIERIRNSNQHTVEQFHYRQQVYDSMEKSARTLFRIDDPEREDELKALVEEKKKAAEEQGVSFDPRTVILPPISDWDAIIIDDNFKAVRHFINIFKYLKAPKVKLIGNQQWRAPELVTPPEPFLAKSVFFDYIGSYQNLPPSVEVSLFESKFFAAPTEANAVDIKIIATHALNLAENAIADPRRRRYQIHQALESIYNKNHNFFGSGLAFNPYHVSRWPTFLFEVHADHITLKQNFNHPNIVKQLGETPQAGKSQNAEMPVSASPSPDPQLSTEQGSDSADDGS